MTPTDTAGSTGLDSADASFEKSFDEFAASGEDSYSASSAGPVDDTVEVVGDTPAPSGTTEPQAHPEPVATPEATKDAVPAEPIDPATPAEPLTPEAQAQAAALQWVTDNSKPFAYSFNGQQRVVDLITEITGEDGTKTILIEPEHAENFRTMMATADRMYSDNKAFIQAGGLQRIAQLDQDYRELKANYAAIDKAGETLLGILNDEGKLAALLQDPRERMLLARELHLLTQTTATATRESYGKEAQEAQARESQGTAERTALNTTMQQFATALPDLTPDDLQAMAKSFGSVLFRPATPQEAQRLGIAVGTRIQDPTVMHEWAKERASWRAQQKALAPKTAAATTENAARTAAIARTTQPVNRAPNRRPGAGGTTAKDTKPAPTKQQMQDYFQSGGQGPRPWAED